MSNWLYSHQKPTCIYNLLELLCMVLNSYVRFCNVHVILIKTFSPQEEKQQAEEVTETLPERHPLQNKSVFDISTLVFEKAQ